MEKSILRLARVDSTSTLLRTMAKDGAPDGRIVIAEAQSAGRGRSGKDFSSPVGGLYLSMLRRSAKALAPGCLTACAAVAVSRAIGEVCGVSPGIKWVNDLVLGGKKICGILVEMLPATQGFAYIIGVGVNVNTTGEDFPCGLRTIAGSILTETGRETDIAALEAAVINHLDVALNAPPGSYRDYYRAHCVTLGREVLVVQGEKSFTAFAESIDDDFGLTVRRPDGSRETVFFGEVSVRGMCGYV